jgi:ribosomal protein RSM22 (predicted rRNA methylase)
MATQRYIRECACDTQSCVADALDEYSKALAVVAPRLPKPLRSLPTIVAEAARQVRVAKTKAAAVMALARAVAVIHKDIILVSSEDVETGKSDRRSGDFVADTLKVASSELVNSGGL